MNIVVTEMLLFSVLVICPALYIGWENPSMGLKWKLVLTGPILFTLATIALTSYAQRDILSLPITIVGSMVGSGAIGLPLIKLGTFLRYHHPFQNRAFR